MVLHQQWSCGIMTSTSTSSLPSTRRLMEATTISYALAHDDCGSRTISPFSAIGCTRATGRTCTISCTRASGAACTSGKHRYGPTQPLS
jgi:hypothetical protein